MQDFSKRLFRQGGMYAAANLALKVGGIVLVPIYLNLLSEESYGHFALLDASARVAILAGGLGLATGLLRFLTQDEYKADHDALPFTALVLAGGAASGTLVLLWGFAPLLAIALLDDIGKTVLVRLMAVYAALKLIEGVPIMLLRTRERAGLYLTATVAELLALIACVFVFVVAWERGLQGIMEAFVVSACLGTLALVVTMLSRIPWLFRWKLSGPLIRFGTPLVLAGLASLFMNIGDRYLLKVLADAATVGVYDWAARLGGVVNMMFVQSFQMAFGVLGLKVLGKSENGVTVYRQTFRHYVIWTGWSVLGLSLLALDLTDLVSTKSAYLAVDVLVLPIALGFMAYGIYNIMMNVLFVTGNTKAIALMVFGSAILNAVLNLLLIPLLDALGAAIATTIAYGFLLVIAARSAESRRKVSYSWRTLALVCFLIIGLYALGQPTASWSVLPRLSARVGLILAYPVIGMALGLYTREDWRKGRQWLKNKRASSQ